jgi:RalA-binding protein 1
MTNATTHPTLAPANSSVLSSPPPTSHSTTSTSTSNTSRVLVGQGGASADTASPYSSNGKQGYCATTRTPLPSGTGLHSSLWQSQDQHLYQRIGVRPERKLNSSLSSSSTGPLTRVAVPGQQQNHHLQPPQYYQQQHQHQHPHSPNYYQNTSTSVSQDQLERLAAEASSIIGGISGNSITPRSESLLPLCPQRQPYDYWVYLSSLCVLFNADSFWCFLSRDRLQQPLQSIPSSARTNNGAVVNPADILAMSSITLGPSRQIPRTSSIDSAISSVSAQSGTSHSHTSSISSNNVFAHISGSSAADIQALIQAAGSAEELIQYMLKEKQSISSQNTQLWRLVDKQRAMILGLNKDLERAMKEKERYRKKLKEQIGGAASAPASSKISHGPDRSLSESPAQSYEGILAESYQRQQSDGSVRSELTSTPDDPDTTNTSPSMDSAPYPITPSPTHTDMHNSTNVIQMPSPTEHAQGNMVDGDSAEDTNDTKVAELNRAELLTRRSPSPMRDGSQIARSGPHKDGVQPERRTPPPTPSRPGVLSGSIAQGI